MKSRFPHHAALLSLLGKNQFEACRMLVEERVEQLMDGPPQPEDQSTELSLVNALKIWQERDRELTALHIYFCRILLGLHQYEVAGRKADIAAFEARKVKDAELLEEALYRAGESYGRSGDFRNAIQRFTDCLDGGAQVFRGEALYGRALCFYSQGAYSHAVPDYEAALAITVDRQPKLARMCRLNLAWVLILVRDFPRAEELLLQLPAEPGSETDRALQLQIAHDRVHLAYLKGQHSDAVKRAASALRMAGKEYSHIRAYIALTLMSMAADQELHQPAFTLGVATKRLAGQARRPDIDEKVGRKMRTLEHQAGTEPLVKALQELRQVLPGALARRKVTKTSNQVGGVG